MAIKERLLTVPQVAEVLNLSPFTVWRMVLDGRLPSHKIGRSRRVAESDVQALLDAGHEVAGKPVGVGVPTRAESQLLQATREAARQRAYAAREAGKTAPPLTPAPQITSTDPIAESEVETLNTRITKLEALYLATKNQLYAAECRIRDLQVAPRVWESRISNLESRLKDAEYISHYLRILAKSALPSGPLSPLYRLVEELDLSVRAQNHLQSAGVRYVGELVQESEQSLLKRKQLGRKTLKEIKDVLSDLGLSLGMRVDGFDPDNVPATESEA